MKDRVEWGTIGVKGLKRYEISNTGMIRIKATGKHLPISVDEKGYKSVMLQYYGAPKKYHIHILLFDTFKIVSQEHPISKSHSLESNKPFNSNEDEYGKGVHRHEWKILKEEIESVEMQRIKTDLNEKREESNLD